MNVPAPTLGHMLDGLAADQANWSRETFGSDSERGPIGPLKHLAKEAKEAQKSAGTEEFAGEMADCLILVLDASRRGGMTACDLVQAAIDKMPINRARDWQKPLNPDEAVEHVR